MTRDTYRFGNVSGPVSTGSGIQQNAGRDIVHSPPVVAAHLGGDALGRLAADLDVLARAVDDYRLSAAERADAQEALAAIGDEAAGDQVDRSRLGDALERLTQILTSANALASGGASVLAAINRIQQWIHGLG
ncbi:MAG: hypothetical protein GY926_01775 [bacterium]|nr:hypothetical protein [bacterium]MCP4963943.1 hypothetical protein [bacterium]